MGKVLVTGACGFLGGNLVRTLCKGDKQILALVGSSGEINPALNGIDNVEQLALDVTHLEPLVDVMADVEGVYHCDAEVTTWGRMESALHHINVAGTRNVCRAVEEAGVAKLIYVSSSEALSAGSADKPANEEQAWDAEQRVSAYTLSRKEAELVVRDHATSGTNRSIIVYPTYMLGPWDWRPSSGKLVLEVARRRAFGYPAGGINIVDVRDVCVAIIQAMEHSVPSERYILGGHNVSYRALFALIAETAGKPKPSLPLPKTVALAAGVLGELWGGVTGREPNMSINLARYIGQEKYYDASRARGELDLPQTPLRKTLEDTLDWFRSVGLM